MAHEYRYPLTRVCLRGGNMTLPRTMIGLFPDDGAVTIVDSLTGQEHAAYMSGPRVVSGLGEFYIEHGLDVNDELLVSQIAEGRFGVTPVVRADAQTDAAADDTAAGEAESGADSVIDAGSATATDSATAGATVSATASGADTDFAVAVDTDAGAVTESEPADETAHYAPRERLDEAEPQEHERTSLDPRLAVREAESALADLEHEGTSALDSEQATLWDAGRQAEVRAEIQAEVLADAHAEERTGAGEAGRQPGSDDQLAGHLVAPPSEEAAASLRTEQAPPAPSPTSARQARGPAYTDAEDDAAALAAVALSTQLRRAFTRLGYRIEPLATGVHFLHAEMGRRRYKVLVQLLRSGERLDWAGLLSRRRNSPANYLAVVGDGADLIRLSHPAELARATLWSWEALERLEELHASVPVTPLDLESHFARDGLFEQGLKRFEAGIAARVAERGAASEVLTRLARNRAPSVFLLEELAQDVNLSRDLVLRILDRFSEAPMHLVARVDSGEFLLRQPVDTALAALASYAESLRQRLPVGRREVITGLGDDDLGSDLLGDELGSQAPPNAEQSEPQAADQ